MTEPTRLQTRVRPVSNINASATRPCPAARHAHGRQTHPTTLVRLGLTLLSLRRACNYSIPDPLRAKPKEEIAVLRARVEELEKLVDRSVTVDKISSASPASSPTRKINDPTQSSISSKLFFLDQRAFTHLHYSLQPVLFPVPSDLVVVLSDEYEKPQGMQLLTSRYFEAVHGWMPIISRTRINKMLDSPTGDAQADTAFLLSCMKLLLQRPLSGTLPENVSLYRIVKTTWSQLEIAGLQSLSVIQSGILIAIYEISHGVYPASYTTVAQCARQAISIGLHVREAPAFLQPWAEWEEEIRVWWFIVMLDRYVRAFQRRI